MGPGACRHIVAQRHRDGLIRNQREGAAAADIFPRENTTFEHDFG